MKILTGKQFIKSHLWLLLAHQMTHSRCMILFLAYVWHNFVFIFFQYEDLFIYICLFSEMMTWRELIHWSVKFFPLEFLSVYLLYLCINPNCSCIDNCLSAVSYDWHSMRINTYMTDIKAILSKIYRKIHEGESVFIWIIKIHWSFVNITFSFVPHAESIAIYELYLWLHLFLLSIYDFSSFWRLHICSFKCTEACFHVVNLGIDSTRFSHCLPGSLVLASDFKICVIGLY